MSSSCRRWPGVSLGHGIHVSPDLDRRCKGGILVVGGRGGIDVRRWKGAQPVSGIKCLFQLCVCVYMRRYVSEHVCMCEHVPVLLINMLVTTKGTYDIYIHYVTYMNKHIHKHGRVCVCAPSCLFIRQIFILHLHLQLPFCSYTILDICAHAFELLNTCMHQCVRVCAYTPGHGVK